MPVECYRLTIQGIAAGEQVQNVLHYVTDNNDDSTPLEMAKEIVDLWFIDPKAAWLAFQSTAYAIRWMQAKRILPGGGNSYWKESPEGADDGVVAQEIGVLQLAPILKLFGGLTDGIQGRIFLPPPPQNYVDGNVITTTLRNAVIDWFDDAKELTDDHDWQIAIFSPKNNAAYSVTAATMSDVIGSQGRRRKPL